MHIDNFGTEVINMHAPYELAGRVDTYRPYAALMMNVTHWFSVAKM